MKGREVEADPVAMQVDQWRFQVLKEDPESGVTSMEDCTNRTYASCRVMLEAFAEQVQRLLEAARDPLAPGSAEILETSNDAWVELYDGPWDDLWANIWAAGVAIRLKRPKPPARLKAVPK